MSKIRQTPSLDLAFDYVKDVLTIQGEAIASLSTRVSFLWGVATAIVGIGVPAAVARELIALPQTRWAMPGVCGVYVLATVFSILALYPRRVETMKHPSDVRERYAVLEREYFTEYLYKDIEQGFKENDAVIQIRSRYLRVVFVLTFIETAIMIGWFISFLH